MAQKLLTADDFRQAAKAGKPPEGTVFRLASGDAQTVGDAKARTKRFVFSDGRIDLAGDMISPKGWQLGDYERNPVALFSHMSWDPPIGRAHNVGVQGDKLIGDIEFASADVYAFADTIYRLVDGGFLKAVSVGFKPTEWSFTNDKDRGFGIDFTKQILLEISVCCVPCNPNALTEARSKGVDTRPLVEWAEKVLDSNDTIFVPRSEIESLRKQAKDAETPRYYIVSRNALTSDAIKRVKAGVDDWLKNGGALVLDGGLELKMLGKDSADWKCGAARDIPVDEDGAWDGAAAEASIFEHAGGDDFDPEKAKMGFLAYDACAPKLRGSYKLPFAHVSGGELKAMASGIRAAASRLPQTDIPDGTKESAKAVIDAYEAKMKKSMGEGSGDGALVPAGDCGLAKDEECGMKNPAQCMTHAPETKSLKSGRRISSANKAKLQQALDCHANAASAHDAMCKCIKDVMDSDEPGDADGDAGNGNTPLDPNEPSEGLDPAQARAREARKIADELAAHLKQ